MQSINTPSWFKILAHLSAWGLFLFFAWTAFNDPDQMKIYTSKDHIEGGGLIENLTVLVLIPGILAGLYSFIRFRHRISPLWTAYWMLLWTLACIYFAGEEISWGQWFFEWETPQVFSEINDQNETNLHNTSTWLDQKPRALVELWIFFSGFVLPIINKISGKNQSTSWYAWSLPVTALFSSALCFTLIRIAGWIDIPDIQILMGNSELRELFIALFLSLFLLSYLARVSGHPGLKD